jgi:general secretion pathway protein H
MTLQRERQSGFTLIEMIVVVAVLGFVLALVASRGPGTSAALTSKAAANELASALRETRSRAIVSNRSVSLTFDLRDRAYRVGDRPVHRLPPGLALSLLTTLGEVRSDTNAGIRFEPDGSSSGGRVELADGRHKLEVGVDWLSGRVKVVDVR